MKQASKQIGDRAIAYTQWLCDKPVGQLFLVHGMAENGQRYQPFANFLSEHHFNVTAIDLRGHGQSKGEKFGYFGFETGYHQLVKDVHILIQMVKKANPSLPLFLLGHSMGSFISMTYAQLFPDGPIDGLLLSGTGGPSMKASLALSEKLLKIEYILRGPKKKAHFFHTFNEFIYAPSFLFKGPSTWLSRDPKVIDYFRRNPDLGFIFTTDALWTMIRANLANLQRKNLNKLNPNLPIYLFSGEKDPVGDYGKGVRQLYILLSMHGNPVDIHLYPEGKHEMLNELNYLEVYYDVLEWLRCQVDKREEQTIDYN